MVYSALIILHLLMDLHVHNAVEDIITKKDWKLIREKYWPTHTAYAELLYEKLKPFANKGDKIANICLYYLSGNPGISYRMSDNERLQYLSVLSFDEMKKIASEDSYFMQRAPFIKTMLLKMDARIETLEKENAALKNELLYMPGGKGYNDAKHEFDITANKQQ